MSKIINGERRYITHWHDTENNIKTKVYFGMKEFEFAEFLCGAGYVSIIPGVGYLYEFTRLKEAMKKFGSNPY